MLLGDPDSDKPCYLKTYKANERVQLTICSNISAIMDWNTLHSPVLLRMTRANSL